MLPIPLIWRYIGGALVLILVVGGIYGWGYDTARDKWKGRLEQERALAQAAYDAKVAENAALSEKLTLLSEKVDNELKPALQAATDRGNSLADSLRNYQNRRCALSRPSTSPAEPSGAAREPGDGPSPEAVDRALSAHLSACERDAERLSAFQRWYGELQQSFAAQ